MQTSNGHVPLTGPSSDPILYGVATALSRLFPPVEHPSAIRENDAVMEGEAEERQADE